MYFWMPGFSIEFEVRVISVRFARRHPTTPRPLLASRNGDFKAIFKEASGGSDSCSLTIRGGCVTALFGSTMMLRCEPCKPDARPGFALEEVTAADFTHVKIPATAGAPSIALKNVEDFSITQSQPVSDM